MAYLVTIVLVLGAGLLALTLDGVIADQWHLIGFLRGLPFSQMPTCNGVLLGMVTCGLIALILSVLSRR